jgi:hypothetical protein
MEIEPNSHTGAVWMIGGSYSRDALQAALRFAVTSPGLTWTKVDH